MSNKKYFFQSYQSYLNFLYFHHKLEDVYELRRVFRKKVKMPSPSGELSYSHKLALVFMGDLIKCHQNMGHEIEFNGNDALLISMMPNLILDLPLDDYEDYEAYRQNPYVKNAFNAFMYSLEEFAKIKPHELILTPFLDDVSKELREEYLELLITSCNTIITSNKHNSEEEEEWVMYLKGGANEEYDDDYSETESGAHYFSCDDEIKK